MFVINFVIFNLLCFIALVHNSLENFRCFVSHIFIAVHFFQNPFVICRLFKKQDESIEVSNCEEAEPTVPSPNDKSSPEDTQSELALAPEPLPSEEQAEVTSEAIAAIDFPGNSCNDYDAEDPVKEEATSEVREKFQSLLNTVFSSILKKVMFFHLSR